MELFLLLEEVVIMVIIYPLGMCEYIEMKTMYGLKLARIFLEKAKEIILANQ